MKLKKQARRAYSCTQETLASFRKLIFNDSGKYKRLTDKEYYAAFGARKTKKGNWKIKDEAKIKIAFEKAWETRNFEIDKFWTRAAYFWGFIAVEMAGYLSLITSEFKQDALKNNVDLYLLLTGTVTTLAWILSIKGSKNWQENWEQHVGMLQQFVTGPLYDIVHYPGRRFYSVSKLSGTIAFMVLLVWLLLLSECLGTYHWTGQLKHWKVPVAVTASVVICFSLIFGYTRGKYYLSAGRKGFIVKK